MALQRVQRIGHTLANANLFIGLQRELTIVIDTNEIRSHDGTTAGGHAILTDAQNAAKYQAIDSDLTAIAAFAAGATGFLARVANAQYAFRNLIAPVTGFTITNNDGVAGNPTFTLANSLAALQGLGSNGIIARTAVDTLTTRTIASGSTALVITNGDGVAGAPTFTLAGDLASIAGFGASGGIVAHTATNTFTLRAIASSTNNIVVTNGDGIAGAPSLSLALDLAVLSGFVAATGIPSRTAANTWSLRAIAGTANQITVTNGDGVAGAPTISLPAAMTMTGITVTGGTFNATALQVAGVSAVLTSRNITTAGSSGLSGGGDLSADRSIILNPVGLTAKTTRALADSIVINDVAGGNVAKSMTFPNAFSGMCIQAVGNQSGALQTLTGTNAMPIASGALSNTAGDQVFTQAITPKVVGSRIEVDVNVILSNGTAFGQLVAALYQDAGATNVTASTSTIPSGTRAIGVNFKYTFTSVSLTTTTFNVRAGSDAGGTVYLNGISATVLFGGNGSSGITIKEYLP